MNPTVKFTGERPAAVRLKEARTATGMSTRAVADLIAKKYPQVAVSHMSIARFESGKADPGMDILVVLATIYERPIRWFLEPSTPLTGIRYRSLSSRVRVKERHQFEIRAQHWLEAYIRLENRLGYKLRRKSTLKIDPNRNPEELARQVRKDYKLKEVDPVVSVMTMLEDFGIRVMQLSTDLKIDGLAAKLGDEHVIVLNSNTSNDRLRLNAGHELYHIASGHCDSAEDSSKEMEDVAFEFASHLLLPTSQLEAAFKDQSAVKLVQYKERFGISMAAMVYRAEKLDIISERAAKFLWIQFTRRGWRGSEPGFVQADRAVRFETMLDRAINQRKLTWNEAANVTGIRSEELIDRVSFAMGVRRQEGGVVYKIRE